MQKKALTPFIYAIMPKANKPKQEIEGLTIFAVERVEEAVDIVEGAKIAEYIHSKIIHECPNITSSGNCPSSWR